MSYRILTMVSAGLLVPALSFAQSGPAPEVGGQRGSGVVYEEETAYDFDDEYVDGSVVRPDGELISGQRHGKESSLIRIRADFIPEMVESVEDL